VAQPTGVNDWFGGDDEDNSGPSSVPLGMIPGQMLGKKLKGRGGLGYTTEIVPEVDPVRIPVYLISV
jgi:hypothetical protein